MRNSLIFIFLCSCMTFTSKACFTSNFYTAEFYYKDPGAVTVALDVHNNLQSLTTICCLQFVRNNSNTLEQQLTSNSLPHDMTLLHYIVATALSLPVEDTEGLTKMKKILEIMPLNLYGGLAFIINQHKKLRVDVKNTLLTHLETCLDDENKITGSILAFFKSWNSYDPPSPQRMVSLAAGSDSTPYQVIEVLLDNGVNVNEIFNEGLNFIPYEVTTKTSESFLQKLKLVLQFKTSHKANLKMKALDLLVAWNDAEWVKGTKTTQVYPSWHKLKKQATREEVEKNKQFFNNVIALIEEYEMLEAQEKGDQVLPFRNQIK